MLASAGRVPVLRTYTKEARALFTQMTVQPSEPLKELYDRFIRELLAGGVWPLLDVAWFVAAHDSQAATLNMKAPGTFTLTAVNSPTFTAYRGYAGNGTTSYLNTGWDVATNGVNTVLDSASIGAYLNAGTDTGATLSSIGSRNASVGLILLPRSTVDAIRGRVHITANVDIAAGAITTRLGLSVLDRSASNLTTAYRNGASVGTAADVSSATASTDIYICCNNQNGTPLLFLDNPVAFAFVGASLGATKELLLYNALIYFLRAIGAQ